MSSEQVSVILPVYNGAQTIEEAVASVMKQTYDHIELIVIDDGSTDETPSLVGKCQKAHASKSVVYIRQENQGVSAARNTGIRRATGDYIAFIDADDRWSPDKITEQVRVLKEKKSIVLLGTGVRSQTERRKTGASGDVQMIPFQRLLCKNYFVTSSVMVRSSALNALGGFNEGQRYAEDYDLWLRIASRYQAAVLHQNLVYYNEGGTGLSSQLWDMQKGEYTTYQYLRQSGQLGRWQFYLVMIVSTGKFIKRIIGQ